MREGRFPHLMQHQVGGRFRTLDGTSTVNSGLSKLIHIRSTKIVLLALWLGMHADIMWQL